MKSPIPVLVVGLIMAGPAWAAPKFPSWDMRAFCTGGVAQTGVDDCIMLQNEARDSLKPIWSQLDAEIRAECLEMLRSDLESDKVPPSYMRLKHCVQFEQKKRGL